MCQQMCQQMWQRMAFSPEQIGEQTLPAPLITGASPLNLSRMSSPKPPFHLISSSFSIGLGLRGIQWLCSNYPTYLGFGLIFMESFPGNCSREWSDSSSHRSVIRQAADCKQPHSSTRNISAPHSFTKNLSAPRSSTRNLLAHSSTRNLSAHSSARNLSAPHSSTRNLAAPKPKLKRIVWRTRSAFPCCNSSLVPLGKNGSFMELGNTSVQTNCS